MKTLTIDATNLVVGRLCAYIAKAALTGHTVEVINIEKAVISGNPLQIVNVYKRRRTMTNYANPENASKWPRRPDFLFKKILSGMFPNTLRGAQAAKRVKAYLGDNGKKGTKPVKDASKLKRNFITLAQLSKELGWNTV